MRQMVMGLLKPYQDRSIQDQEEFKKIREFQFNFEEQVDKLNRTVFEDGQGVQIFDVLRAEITQIN